MQLLAIEFLSFACIVFLAGVSNKFMKNASHWKQKQHQRQSGEFDETKSKLSVQKSQGSKKQKTAGETWQRCYRMVEPYVVNSVSNSTLVLPASLLRQPAESDMVMNLNVQRTAELFYGRLNSNQFPPVVVHCKDPAGASNIFRTSANVISGVKDLTSMVYQQMQLCLLISRIQGVPILPYATLIQNVVMTAALGFEIDCDHFHYDHSNTTDFAPQMIGCVRAFRSNGDKKSALLVYRTGNMVLTGHTSVQALVDFANSFDWLKYRVYRDEKGNPITDNRQPNPNETSPMDETPLAGPPKPRLVTKRKLI